MRVYTVQTKTAIGGTALSLSGEKGQPLAGTCVYCYTTAYREQRGIPRSKKMVTEFNPIIPRVGTVLPNDNQPSEYDPSLTLA